MTIRKILAVLLFVFVLSTSGKAQNHPHIIVNKDDKQFILDKIKQQPWAQQIFTKIFDDVTPYVERHQTDPDWILSRYLMNRIPGKRYTRFYSDDEGTRLVKYAGDAPFPTVRVSPHKRQPISKNGFSYQKPTLEELIPNDTSMLMLLQSTEPGSKKEWVDPQAYVGDINQTINHLVLEASIVYWITGKEVYAKFAADVLNQWARGVWYQEPIIGPVRTGLIDIQTLGDGATEPMILAYDFLYDYIREKKYETKYYEGVFTKIANTLTIRGYINNNWFAAETPPLVYAALSIEDKKLRDYYLSFFLSRDTIVEGGGGQLSLPTALKKWFTPDGHWKEPGGYHNYPVGSLLRSALAMEKNGYPVFQQYPTLFNSSFVMLKYSFPNFKVSSFGDTGRPSQSPEMLEIGIEMADKYKLQVLNQLTASIDVLIKNKQYKREESGFMGLLSYLPTIPPSKGVSYQWPRSGSLDFAKCYLQRNGMDPENGLMFVVQGATYNHNHANGMSMELYGAGYNMGIDPGKGLTYEAPMHVNYYAQFAAHNTVTADARSASVPYFRGGGGTKNIGQIELESMEPRPEKEAVSPYCSFTDTRYVEGSTGTNQQRTMAIIRTSATTGYYVDIYRSDNPKSNEYIYHNIGNSVSLSTPAMVPIELKPTQFPISTKPFDPPGFRCINQYQHSGDQPNGVVALFSLTNDPDHQKFMQVLFAGEEKRDFYTGMAPSSGTAQPPYNAKPTPTIICRQEGEAWIKPFIAVYEPYQGVKSATVQSVGLLDKMQSGTFSALRIANKSLNEQLVLQDVKGEQLHAKGEWCFQGFMGVISLSKQHVDYLYLGEGTQISYKAFSLNTKTRKGSANLMMEDDKYTITCNQATVVGLPASGHTKGYIQIGAEKKALKTTNKENVISFVVPAVKDAVITFE